MTAAGWLAELASDEVYRAGAVLLGTAITGEQVRYVLHDRTQVRHGLIVGGRGAGVTEAVRTVIHAVRRCGEWSELLGEYPVEDWRPFDAHVSDWPPAHPHRVIAQLEAIEQLLRARSTFVTRHSPARLPAPATPGLLWVIEGLDRLIVEQPCMHDAAFVDRLEQVLHAGPRVGIAVLATVSSLHVDGFAGPRLRDLLTATNVIVLRQTNAADTALTAQLALDVDLDRRLQALPRGGGWAVVLHPDRADTQTLRLRLVARSPQSLALARAEAVSSA